MNKPIYYPEDQYKAVVAVVKRIATITPSLQIEVSAWTGTITDDEVKIALGERFNFWPESILPHVESPATRPAN